MTPQNYQVLDESLATLALWYCVNTSLSAFYKLFHEFGSCLSALEQPVSVWQALGIHKAHIKRYQDVADTLAFVEHTWQKRQSGAYGILFLNDDAYPSQLKEIYDPPPVLFYQGEATRLSDKQIAIVGSRHPTPYAQAVSFDMAQYLAYAGFTIISGLAQGVDKAAHLGALTQEINLGRTVGVMGTGIDVCYPKNHHALYAQIIKAGGCLVSELLPSTPASKHAFPRRNRLVAGLATATVVTEAAMQSGSLITARLSAEMGKQVFAVPSQIDNLNAQGCHHLIREGATLIYHPSQILEDLGVAMPSTGTVPVSEQKTKHIDEMSVSSTPSHAISEHLQAVFLALSSQGVDLDTLVATTGLSVSELLAQLLELELMGVVRSIGGRYERI